MPKIAIDYSKTIIYKLCCNDLSVTDLYVGHTTNFTKRKAEHKSNCCNKNKKEYNYKVYQFIRENGGWDNWNMVQIEEFCCNNKREAEARERYWYEELKGTLNTNNPSRTIKEWYEDNKDKIKEQHKKYYEENKEKKTEYNKEHREKHKEYMKIYNEANKQKHKEYKKDYYEANKEQRKKYYEENKEQILAKQKEYQKAKKLNPPPDL